jgi:S-(hydroxymethyl)glutathione dehydrogenase/alcohol dehydrogenase
MTRQCKAAILWNIGEQWSVEDVELRDVGPGTVLVEVKASGLCHSDDHNVTGDFPGPIPLVGGHEGAGVVLEVGEGVTRVKPGDHVLMFPTPACGQCRFCNDGRSYLCDLNAWALQPTGADGVMPFTAQGRPVSAYTQLGTFSQYLVANQLQMIKIDHSIPFDAACLVGCGVATGWGASVNIAKPRIGDTVAVVGVGGVGMAAVQGARVAGASNVVAIDPVAFKRDQALKFGATHAAADIDEAKQIVSDLTLNVMADSVILTVGVLEGSLFAEVADLVAKGGTVCVTSVARFDDNSIQVPISAFCLSNKAIVGNVFGLTNPLWDVPRIFDMYKRGELKLDEMITRRYRLDEINEGYADMHAGKNIRGVIVHD